MVIGIGVGGIGVGFGRIFIKEFDVIINSLKLFVHSCMPLFDSLYSKKNTLLGL